MEVLEYIILFVVLITAIGSIYIIVNMSKPINVAVNITDTDGKKENTIRVLRDSSGNVYRDDEITPPYATDSIQSVDDYEYSMVFQNEGDRAMTKSTRDLLMSQYPMDWTVQPPSSDLFQQGLASYKESFQNPRELPSKNPYSSIDGSDMKPPVLKDENEILSKYVPKKPNELTTYDAADAKELVDKIYAAKGLRAEMKKIGENAYTVVTSRLNEKVLYEDEVADVSGNHATASVNAVKSMGEQPGTNLPTTFGEGTFEVPATVDNYKNPDPFFTVNTGERSRDGKWNYASWTPGLERMFAPTEPQANWY